MRSVITYPSFDGALAAAVVAGAFEDAQIEITSARRVARALARVAKDAPEEVHVTGVGIHCPLEDVLAQLDRLQRGGARVFWYVRGDYLDPFRERLEGLASLHAAPEAPSLAHVVARSLPGDRSQRDRLLALALGEPDRQADRDLVDYVNACMQRYFKFQDRSAYPGAIRRLLDPAPLAASEQAEVARYRQFGGRFLLGRSEAIRGVRDFIALAGADRDARVLITGETGTGKEIVARLIHEASPRRDAPFFAVNCGTFNANLLDSRLFGHEKGAFTGAHRRRVGVFEEADGGTLFLDEVAEIPIELQAKLLRVLQEGTLTRLGGASEIRVDVRAIAATHQDLLKDTRDGRFREDLFYRLNVLAIHVPPLREHPEDVVDLANDMLYRFTRARRKAPWRLDDAQSKTLSAHPWPGNVRELENVIERAVVLDERDFSQLLDTGHAEENAFARVVPLADIEARYVLWAYRQLGQNKQRTANALGISVNTLKARLRGPKL